MALQSPQVSLRSGHEQQVSDASKGLYSLDNPVTSVCLHNHTTPSSSQYHEHYEVKAHSTATFYSLYCPFEQVKSWQSEAITVPGLLRTVTVMKNSIPALRFYSPCEMPDGSFDTSKSASKLALMYGSKHGAGMSMAHQFAVPTAPTWELARNSDLQTCGSTST